MKKFARLFVIALLLLIVFCFLVPAVSAEEFIANQTNVSLSAKIPISEPVAALSVQTNGSFSGGAADSPVLLLNPDTEGIGSEIHRNDTSYRFGRPANIFSPNPSGGVLPVANFVGTPTSGIAPHTVSFTDISSNSPTGWAWYFGDENYTAPWTRVTASAGWTGRGEHSSVAMPDGSIVLLGGITDISPFIMNDTWRSTDNGATWTRVTASAGWLARCGHTSVVMPDGSIVLMGGYSGGGGVKNDTWRSTDNGATWTRVNASAGWTGRQGHSSVAMPDGSIVLMGGFDSGFKNDVWRSTDKGATWTQVNASAGWTPRDAHSSVAMPDGSIVLMGGAVSGGTFKNDVWRSTNNGTTWTQVNASAGWSTGYSHSSVAMLDGSIVLMGGYGGGYKNGTWRSTDKGASWTQVNISSGWSARNDHTSVVMPDGSIVLMGGRDSGYNYMNDTWRFMPVGSSAQNPSHTYTTPGIYQVALQVYNAGGYNSTRRTGYITVIGAPIPHFTANVTAGAAPLTVQFYDNSIGIPTSWNWSFGDGYFSVLQNPAHTYTYVGTYTVSLNTTNALGSNTATRTNYIIISVIRPIPDFSANVTLGTAPLSVSFTDLSLKNPIGWAWYFGDENFTVPWTLVNASAGWTARWSHSSVAMPDGSIVLLGGADTDGYKNDVWQSTDNGAMWTQVNASAGWTARYFHSSVVMPDGSIVLLGGADTDGYKNDVWRSTDNGTTWRRVNASAGWTARWSHSCVVMPDGSIVLMGGYDTGGYKNDTWRSTDNGATWAQVNTSAGWTARYGHSSVMIPDGSIVLMGGYDTGGYKNDTWRSTDNGATWAQVNASAGWTARYGHSSVVIPDGSIVLTGAIDTDGYKNDVWRSTDNGTTWRRVNASAGWTARYGHHSVAMRDGSIVLTGGWDGKNPRKNDVWQFISVGSSAKNPSHVYTKPGRYPVALQSYNTEGYNSTRKTGYIRVIVGPDLIGEIVDTPQFVKKNADNSIHYNITFAIRNIGDADVINPFTIHFKAPGMPGMISNVTFGNDIPANHTLTMEFQMNVIPTETETTITLYSQGSTKLITVITGGNISVGVHEISMGIDVDNDIQELNETNNYVNTTTYVLPFSAPKQLQVSSASGNSGVILYVSANGTSNFSGANIQLTWDPAVMNVTNIQDLSGLGAFNHSPVPATTGSMVFNVSGPNSFSGVTNQQSTKLK